MAFENVNTKNLVKVNELAVGESLTGYYLGYKESTQYEGQYNLIMKIDGEVATVPAVGNLKYMVTDNKLKAGALTRITREEDKKVKGGKKATQCVVEQDPEDTTEFDPAMSTPITRKPYGGTADPNIGAKIQSLKG